MKTKLTLMVVMAVACAAVQLAAMPTEDEAKRAEPAVQKLLEPERAALKSGKKTYSEVAVAAMKLVGEVDTDAEKLLLMKGAFVLYVLDGNFEKSVETMKALKAAIPDIPPQSITNLIETALLGVAKKEDGARLYKLLDESNVDIASVVVEERNQIVPETATEKTRKAIAKLFPGWSLDSEVPQGDGQPEHSSGFHASHRGRNNIIRLHPVNKETPVVLSRTVKLPDNNPCLSLSVSSWNDDADFLLSVRVNGMDALTNRIVCTTDAAPWEDFVVPLSPWRGNSVKLEIILSANNWWCEWSHLARVDIIEADGDMSIKEGKCEVDGYTWSYRAQNGEATIVAENDGRFSTAVSPCPVGSITIPATIAGAKVTHIGRDAFRDCSALTSVTVPDGVLRIGRGAFRNCTGLKSIKIPSSVQIIERDAFAGCNGLASVSIPEGVTSIDRGAFYWCCGLGSIEIPSSVTQIGVAAFRDCKGLTSVTIPKKVTDIGDSAFHGCNALTSVTISASVTNINNVAFRNTSALTSFQVDPGNRFYKSENGLLLTKDGATLVRGINGDVAIPPSVTAIGPCAFEGCVALRSAEIPSGVKSIGPYAFKQCRGMKSVTIPSSVTDIEREAFHNCKGLKSIAIPQGVTVIRNSTFTGSSLTEVVIPANVKVLERGAFSWCGELKSVTFPEGMTLIGRDAFYSCGKLTTLVIPSSVQRIEQGAFYGCGSLTSVTMRGERPNVPNNIFDRCGNLKAIHVPANAKSWEGMKDWHGIPLVFDGDVAGTEVGASGIQTELRELKSERSVSDMTYTDNVGCTWSYADNNEGSLTITGVSLQTPSSVTIPTFLKGKNVTRIGNDAFRNNAMIKGVTIPGCIVGIGDRAFVGCANLEELTILEGVKAIGGSDAFRGCPKLKSVTIPPSLTFIRQRAFKNMPDESMKVNVDSIEHWLSIVFGTGGSNPLCNGKSYLCVKGAPVVDLKIPDGTKEIKGCAFCGYSALKSISIPGSVQRIGSEAFAYMKGARILFASNIGTVEIAGGAFHSSSGCQIEVAPKPGCVFAGWEDEQGKLVDDILSQKQRIVVTPRWNRRKEGSVD